MIPELDSSLKAVVGRARTLGFARRLGPWGASALVGVGVLALVLRVFWDLNELSLALVVAALPAVVVAAWIAAARKAPQRSQAVVWLDERSGGAGTLLAEYELGDPRWVDAARRALARIGVLPGVTARQLATRALPALAFALTCAMVPIPRAAAPANTAYFERVVDELREKLDALEEQVELDDETRAELEERLANLDSELGSGMAEALFESLDQLETRMEELALGAQTAAESAMEELAAAADKAADDPSTAGSDFESALADLKAAGLDPSLSPQLSQALGELMEELNSLESGAIDASQLSELSDELSDLLNGKLQDLADAGLLDPSNLKKGQVAKLSEFKEHECDEDCEAGT